MTEPSPPAEPPKPSLTTSIRALQAQAAAGDQNAARHLAFIVKRIRAARSTAHLSPPLGCRRRAYR
jgi:hypothetical protein